ncbi:hypothetical protein C8351_05580 [Salmonella enterica]|nr:hypothetical protein [Salmonella enterica]ECE0404095.1 hypothetical protein [Salmonella enterica subsp. enterica]ECF2180486.1 hypothetical protein [Salmonella enterica subsp. enterica]EDV1534429.1 hypothetical protein [Salmonella enterica subsp. enterica]QEC91857.1 hypothetical protein C8351_05580 [Salmonella enterica]
MFSTEIISANEEFFEVFKFVFFKYLSEHTFLFVIFIIITFVLLYYFLPLNSTKHLSDDKLTSNRKRISFLLVILLFINAYEFKQTWNNHVSYPINDYGQYNKIK